MTSEPIMASEVDAKRFNLNDYVWVRLTEKGWQIFDESYRALGLDPAPYREIVGGPDRYQRFQMWELMHMFGPHCQMGMGGFIDGLDVWLSDPKAGAGGSHVS